MSNFLNSIPLLRIWVLPLAICISLLLLGTLWGLGLRKLKIRTQVLIILICGLITAGCWYSVDVVWHPFAEGIGRVAWAWIGVFLLACTMGVVAVVRASAHRLRRFFAVLGICVLALASSAAGINYHFGAYPSLGSLFQAGIHTAKWDDLSLAPASQTQVLNLDTPLEKQWHAEGALPEEGTFAQVNIPSSNDDFHPRSALLYLPPAYFASNRPALPVLVMLAGQPGAPIDWRTLGNLDTALNTYAAQHEGLTPIVAVVDHLGDAVINPLCSNAYKGHVATYLEKDVPAWLKSHLGVNPNPRYWAIAGPSNGGTCALQVVTRSPQTYQTFLDMSGEEHPTLGSEERTIAQGFGGNREAYLANDPLNLMSHSKYPEIAGIFSWGRTDKRFEAQMQKVAEAARASGMTVETRAYPGGHSWRVWSHAFNDQVDWLGRRLGLTS